MKQLPSVNSELNDEQIDKIFKNHFDILSPFFLKLMSEWTIGAYKVFKDIDNYTCLLYTSPSPRDVEESRMPSSA